MEYFTRRRNKKDIRIRRLIAIYNFTVIFCVAALSTSYMVAQEKNIATTNQQWVQYLIQSRLRENWIWQNDVGYRWRESLSNRSQYSIRTAFGYAIQPNLSVSAGFAYQGTYVVAKVAKIEFRPYQELAYKNKFKSIGIGHRFRIEERFINPVVDGKLQTPNTFNFRFRYSLMITLPFFKLSQKYPDRSLMCTLGDELFINDGSTAAPTLFDQNRIFLGPSLQWNKKLTLSLTYMNQYGTTVIPETFRRTHVIWFQVKHELNLTHHKIPGVNGSPQI